MTSCKSGLHGPRRTLFCTQIMGASLIDHPGGLSGVQRQGNETHVGELSTSVLSLAWNQSPWNESRLAGAMAAAPCSSSLRCLLTLWNGKRLWCPCAWIAAPNLGLQESGTRAHTFCPAHGMTLRVSGRSIGHLLLRAPAQRTCSFSLYVCLGKLHIHDGHRP